jgi:hypothetical protein
LQKDIKNLKEEYITYMEDKIKETSDKMPEKLEEDIRRKLRAKGII